MDEQHFPDFYIVWSPTGSSPPRYRHPSYTSARNEAERLARCSAGAEFFVMQVCSRSALPTMTTTYAQGFGNAIPF